MLRLNRRLGISNETIEAVKVARIAKALNCLPSQVRAERADDIEVFMKVEQLDRENEAKHNQANQ